STSARERATTAAGSSSRAPRPTWSPRGPPSPESTSRSTWAPDPPRPGVPAGTPGPGPPDRPAGSAVAAAAEPAQQPACLLTAAGVGRGTADLLGRTPSLRAPAELLETLQHARHGLLLSEVRAETPRPPHGPVTPARRAHPPASPVRDRAPHVTAPVPEAAHPPRDGAYG